MIKGQKMLNRIIALNVIFLFVVIISSAYSQPDNNIVLWQEDNFCFSVCVPEGWIAIENANPQKLICCYFYKKDSIYTLLSMFIGLHLLKDETDGSLIEFAENIEKRIAENNKGTDYLKIDYKYKITEYSITYNGNIQGIYFSRSVYVRYKKYGFQINLSTMYENPGDELIGILDSLVNLWGFNSPPLWGVRLGVWGICSPTYTKISRINLQYPAALPRGFFISLEIKE
jgi:hypothetical protein